MANSDMMHKAEQKVRQNQVEQIKSDIIEEQSVSENVDPFAMWEAHNSVSNEESCEKKSAANIQKKAAAIGNGPVLAPTSRAGIRNRVNSGKASGKLSVVRDVPKVLLTEMFREFPNARNQTDALVAYTICHSPGSLLDRALMDLTQDQIDLINTWEGNAFSGIEEKLDKLAPTVQNIQRLVRVVEVLSAYMTYDRLGFRTSDPLTVEDVNLNEESLLDFLVKMEGQSTGIQHEKDLMTGRK